jgi:glycosyltransferase involved in cell wall biosynthesis
MRRLGRVAARHIAITDVQRNFLIDTFGYPPERVVIVHNGIDTSLFRPPAPGEVAPHGPTCINVARLSPQKGHNVLLDAMAIVVKQVPGARLVVIGDGELRGALRERIRDLGLDDHVELTGSLPREQVASRLRGADLFILPSRYEGSPLALMEAMASGLACVATDVSGVRELITGGATGRIVPVGIPAAMAAAIVELLSNHWVRSAIGVASRQVVVAGFNLERSMSETEAVLSEIVGG